MPDHSQGNALAERMIQTSQEKLALNTCDEADRVNWNVTLPITALVINTSVNITTGLSPYEMLFGRKYRMLGTSVTSLTNTLDTHTALIKQTLENLNNAARIRQRDAIARNEQRYGSSRNEVEFQKGDRVLVRVYSRRSKLGERFIGPYEVTGRDHDIYTLKKGTNKPITRHVDSLKKFLAPNNRAVGRIWLTSAIILSLLTKTLALKPPVLWRPVSSAHDKP